MFEKFYPWFMVHGIKILSILIAAVIINRIGKKFIERVVRRAAKHVDHEAETKKENTLIQVFSGALRLVVWLIAIMMILPEFGISIGPILAGAGLLGLVIGFGAQHMIRDLLAGLLF